ncbi:DNA-binding GntR family transcriptional regulator [Leucobacter exalbidus]|uniref:DNA-binding GntR family transcriptional regulator n=1 Tax=Leucobacter exalbidus TaxID=662960 RepID=A0A940SZF1_9MICO|nr:GntR family transcriptional regulator [Leucobacter exalbidus]MBP1324840.1 DNA-binding GntR family transcriptional regulator [Leucobacter exalbidus]
MTTSHETTPSSERSTYDRLRALVLSLELLPGERLSERGLEDTLGASRTPIRAALMRLENEGLTRRLGRGWQVTPVDLTEIRSAMEFRETLEAGIVALAAQQADAEAVQALVELSETPEGEPDDAETGLRGGTDFHVVLAMLTGNHFFADAIRDVMTRISRTRWLEVRTEASRAQLRAEHRAIAEAIGAGDPAAAVALSRAHTHGTRDRLMATLDAERHRLRARGLSIIESETLG